MVSRVRSHSVQGLLQRPAPAAEETSASVSTHTEFTIQTLRRARQLDTHFSSLPCFVDYCRRFQFPFRFIGATHLEDENGTIAEARPATAAASSAASAASSSAPASSSSSSSASSSSSSAAVASLTKRTVASLAKHVGVLNSFHKKSASSLSCVSTATSNAGIPGDVLQILEPALTGVIECTNLSFKNTFNHFDRIGHVQIVQVCCGHRHAGAVTAGGSLFMWGSNANSELGFVTGDEKEVLEPQVVQMPGNRPVRMVACGFEHSVCITMDSCAFSWGSGLMGILGHQSDSNRDTPTQIDLHWDASTAADPNEKLVWVACGPHNTGIVAQGRADRKQIYTCGGGEYGTLGTGTKIPSLQPQLIRVEDKQAAAAGASKAPSDEFPVIAELCFGTNHAIAVSTTGACYSWGSNQFGQL